MLSRFTLVTLIAVLSVSALSSLAAADPIDVTTVDMDSMAFSINQSNMRATFEERRADSIMVAVFVFAGILLLSCIPCGCVWYTLYKELNSGASWAKPSSLFMVPQSSNTIGTPFRPTSPMTYRAAGPSPVVIRQA